MTEILVAKRHSAYLPVLSGFPWILEEDDFDAYSQYDEVIGNLTNSIQHVITNAVVQCGTHFTYGQIEAMSSADVDLSFYTLPTTMFSYVSNTLPDWVNRFRQFCSEGRGDAALREISLATTRLKSAGDFAQLRDGLKKIDLAQLPDIALVGLLRNVFSVRSHIEEWNSLVSQAEKLLVKRGRNPRALLRGLKSFS